MSQPKSNRTVDSETPSNRSTTLSNQPDHSEYKAYNQGYYRGRSQSIDEDQKTKGFLIGAALVLLFGLGGLIAYLVLQKQPVNVFPPAPAPQENVDQSDTPELSQPDVNVTITEPEATETPISEPSSNAPSDTPSTATPPSVNTNVNVEAPTPSAPASNNGSAPSSSSTQLPEVPASQRESAGELPTSSSQSSEQPANATAPQ